MWVPQKAWVLIRVCALQGPLEALSQHVADPWNANFATNGVSIPFLS